MNTVMLNAVGPSVYYLQLALARSGYRIGAIDGVFGQKTLKGLQDFQMDNNLFPDGIAGPRTWRKLTPFLTGYTLYTVTYSDTLFKLARRYFSTVDAILIANPEVNPANLQVGQRLIIPYTMFDVVSSNVPVTYELLLLWIEGLVARYPFIRTSSIGNSVSGRSIPELVLGRGNYHVMINASHHANESITTTVVMKYCENLAKSYSFGGFMNEGNNESVSSISIYNNAMLHIIPLVNPDGVDLVNGYLQESGSSLYNQAAELASTYPQIPFPSGWKANIRGVDLNLNYPAGWETAREIKFSQGFTQPGPRDYVGSAPLTEPETNAMVRYTGANLFDITLSYHTQGNVIYWKFSDYNPPRSLEIGTQLSQASGYTLELTPPESAYAGYKDWFIQTYNRPGYTIECGIGINPLPLSQFDTIYAANEPLITKALTAR